MPFLIKCFLWPIRFPATNPTIRVTTNGVTETLVLAVNADEDYWVSNDGQVATGQRDLVERLQTCLRTATGGAGYSVTLNSTNALSVTHATQPFSLLLGNVLTTIDPTIFGYTASTFVGIGVGPYTTSAPNQTKGFWSPDQPQRLDTGFFGDEPIILGSTLESTGTSSRTEINDTGKFERQISYDLLPVRKVKTGSALATEPYGALEYAWVTGLIGGNMRIYDDRGNRTTHKKYRTQRSLKRPWRRMDQKKIVWYAVDFDLVRTGVYP